MTFLSVLIGWYQMALFGWARHAHELTHCAVAWPWAESVEYDRESIDAVLEWRASTPTTVVRLAHLAPTLVGLLAAVVVVLSPEVASSRAHEVGHSAAVWLGEPSLSGEFALAVAMILAVNWLAFTIPSFEDLRPLATVK